MRNFLHTIWVTRDLPGGVLLAVMGLVGGWVMLGFFSSSVQRANLDRFHLNTPSFAGWGIQQPIPAMYNFENRYWVSRVPLTNLDLQLSPAEIRQRMGESLIDTGYANHFPTRIFTFGDGRNKYLKGQTESVFLYVQSRYRQQLKVTSFLAAPTPDQKTGFEFHRRGSEWRYLGIVPP